MPNYDYLCKKCDTEYNVNHGIKQDAFKKHYCPKCDSVQKCVRLISPNCCSIKFVGDGWTIKESGFGKRGYEGKFGKLIRDKGSPVDAPSNKREADQQFQKFLDSGGLDGIEPTLKEGDKFNSKPMSAEEMVDKGKGNS
ncbi:MAG TPA: hypothetical protein VMZ91_12800 [Candidatus Paceibacterota bacterium]|nr:hypothetical protein [Candidatus Paceibacterota bacterium]